MARTWPASSAATPPSPPASGYTHSFWGIAPKVRFVNLRVLDRNGAGTDSMVIAAIQRAIALKSTYNIKIINLSLGRPVMESYLQDPLCQAVEQAWKAGIVVVVAAGNEGRNNTKGTSGYGTITSPGNDPYVITVGAMKDIEDALPRRRPDGQLQLQGTDAVRPDRQARPGGSRQQDHRRPSGRPRAHQHLSGRTRCMLSYYVAERQRPGLGLLLRD